MSQPRKPRVRARNGLPQPPFYCRYGRHRTYDAEFERDHRNTGICMQCAFKLYALMDAYFPAAMAKDAEEAAKILNEQIADRERNRKIAKLARGQHDPGWIYYIEQADLIKIGYSENPVNRIKSYGPTAVLLAIHPGTPALEKEIHQRFRRYLARGREWYSRDSVLVAHAESVRQQFGDPSVFAYAYTIPPEKRGAGVSDSRGGRRFQMIG